MTKTLAKVEFDAAMQRCCDILNDCLPPQGAPRRPANYSTGQVSIEYEIARSNVSVYVDPRLDRSGIQGLVRVSCNASQLDATAASAFAELYRFAATQAASLQSYMDSIEMFMEVKK